MIKYTDSTYNTNEGNVETTNGFLYAAKLTDNTITQEYPNPTNGAEKYKYLILNSDGRSPKGKFYVISGMSFSC